MQSWITGFQESIDYIEQNLTDVLDVEKIAEKAALSPFYYQRIFCALCGMTVGEYIRGRRMTLAAQELAGSDSRVIDVAVRYGYDSPDSFAKAFQRFHGITPSQAREPGGTLRSLTPLHIKITMESRAHRVRKLLAHRARDGGQKHVGLSNRRKGTVYHCRLQTALQLRNQLSGDPEVLESMEI